MTGSRRLLRFQNFGVWFGVNFDLWFGLAGCGLIHTHVTDARP